MADRNGTVQPDPGEGFTLSAQRIHVKCCRGITVGGRGGLTCPNKTAHPAKGEPVKCQNSTTEPFGSHDLPSPGIAL